MIDGNQLREEFGRYLAEHKATRWGMDAALMHVCKIAYDAGKADGPATPERKVGMHPALGAPYGPQAAAEMTDYMKEAERLSRVLEDIAQTALRGVENEQIRGHLMDAAALLAHIQRGAVPEGWKEATIAWEVCASIHREYAKKKDPFFTTRQADFVRRTEAARAALLATTPDNFRDAAKMVAEPAEVPMPKPVAYGFGNTAITGHTNRLMMVRIDIPGGDQYAGAYWLPLVLADEARTYGAACRDAGYSRAANWLRVKAEKHAEENGYHEPDTGAFAFASRAAEEWNNSVLELADEMEAALRGEVKP